MKTLKVKNDDIVLTSKRRFEIVEGKEEKAQSIQRIVSTNLGEWFLNLDFGFDYSLLQTKKFDKDEIRFALIDAVTQDERVDEVKNITFDFDNKNRKMNITFTAVMDNEEVEVSI